MQHRPHNVSFQPDGKKVSVLTGTTILEAASRAGIVLEAPCGGNGTCGKCRVRVPQNAPDPNEKERKFLSPDELAEGFRLACQHEIDGPMSIVIPSSSRMYEQKILMAGIEREVALEPNIKKTYVELDKPSVADLRCDLDRLSDAIDGGDGDGRLEPSLDLIRRIPDKLRRNEFKVTLVTEGGELIAVESGDTSDRNFGVAVDLGTTTVVGMLVDLNTGKQLASSARGNPQTTYGDDVVSRIQRCIEDEAATGQLHQQAVHCINEIIRDLAKHANIEPKFIYEICVAGNTTMTHLLLDIPPNSLGAAPYVGAVRQSFEVKAEPMGFIANHHARLYTLPNIAGFVGGDTVGVVLSSGLDEADELTLAVDIGTNGEIVLGTKERMVACSTAAGPAFEGARIVQGMRATNGAIDKAVITPDEVVVNVLGGAKARGICGTGLIDVVARLIEIGVIDMGGQINGPDDLGDGVGDEIKRRLTPGKAGYRFTLAFPEESETGHGVHLTQGDVRELQLAKGAIMTGIILLARELGVEVDDIQHVMLAGAFGNYINPRSAKIIGLIPDLPDNRLRFIGNAAGAGARMALVSSSYRAKACAISRNADYIEMAASSEFQTEFMMQMMFMPCETC